MINKIQHEQILEINLARPPVNALNGALVNALTEAVKQAPNEGYRAIVLSGSPGIFSAGLDVPELLQLDRCGLSAFWQDFFAMLETVARSAIPVVAAITGHSPAGGAVLSLFCDYRIMSRGDFKVGLNEVQVGLVVPMVIQKALMRLIGRHQAERLLVAGAMLNPDQAHAIGLVDRLTDADSTIEEALQWCRQHAGLPQLAMLTTRQMARGNLTLLFDDASLLRVEEFVSHWFKPETQNVLQNLVARLKGK